MRFSKVCILVPVLAVAWYAASAQETTVQSLEGRVGAIGAGGSHLRSPGSPEGRAAAEYIASVFEEAGLSPFYAGDYIDEFTSEPLVGGARKTYRNVAGIIYGSDLTLDGEYIIIGAHYDFNGQNDNVSGIAALLELATSLKECSPGRNVILAAFDGFELGLLGSRRFVAQSSVPSEAVCLMVNLQLVGGFEGGDKTVNYSVKNISQKGMDAFMSATSHYDDAYNISVNWNGFKGRTDTEPFTAAGIPTIHVTTWSQINNTGDNYIDYSVLKDITDLVSESVCVSANAPFFDRPVVKEKKGPRFEGGITVAAGSSFVRQSDGGGMRGKTMFSYGAGLYGQFNISYLGLRPEVQFVRSGSRYQNGILRMNSVVIPFSIVVQSPPILPVIIRLYAGGYYRRTFGGAQAGNDLDFANIWYRNGAGIQWGIEMRFNHYGIGVNNRYGLTDMLRTGNNKMTERATYFTLSYTF